jgi:protein-tyrosine-phosphatase
MSTKRPSAVLFVCTLNAVRSPMAAAILHKLAKHEVYVASAGVRAGDPDPFAGVVMDEIDLDLTRHRPHSLEDLADSTFDLVITLSPEARQRVADLSRTHAFEMEHWDIRNPSSDGGSRDQILESYRAVRKELESQISKRFS